MIDGPTGIAIDVGAQKLYVASTHTNEIITMNLAGSNAQSLGNPGDLLIGPLGIALDFKHGKFYVTTSHNRIIKANLDGTKAENLGNPNNLLVRPAGIALDLR